MPDEYARTSWDIAEEFLGRSGRILHPMKEAQEGHTVFLERKYISS